MLKDCNDCKNKLVCVQCEKVLCHRENDECRIQGHYLCPVLGVVCIKCEKIVKKNRVC